MHRAPRTSARRAREAAAVLLAAGLAAGGCRREAPAPGPAGGPRVVSLAPSLTEIVCAIGAADLLVGRSSACNHPPGVVRRIPVAGDFGRPSLEVIAGLRPAIVLEADLEDEAARRAIASLGIRCERIACRRLDDLPPAVRRVGALLGREAGAEAVAARVEAGLRERRARAAGRTAPRPTVYAEIWRDPLMTVGEGSFIHELVALAGGEGLGRGIDRDYFQVSPEWVVARDPEVILCLYMAPAAEVRAQVAGRVGWSQTRAVRAGRVYGGFDADALLRPGPRVIEGIEALERCLAPAVPGGAAP